MSESRWDVPVGWGMVRNALRPGAPAFWSVSGGPASHHLRDLRETLRWTAMESVFICVICGPPRGAMSQHPESCNGIFAPMPHPRRLIPLLVTALVIQGLVGVVPHTHRTGGLEAEVARADSGLITIYETDESAHDGLACSVHARMVEAAASRGIVHGVVQA